MVVRHLAEQVVCDVRVGDVVERRVQDAPEAAVHGGERAAQPRPLAAIVVRQRWVRVLRACGVQQGLVQQEHVALA